jgi:polyisoprenoid-binding protein YceI
MVLAKLRRPLAIGALVAALGAPPLLAQQMPQPLHDYKAAPAGDYAIDPSHTSVVIRVSHLGFSYEVFRFQTVSGDLTWDPANPAANKLTVTVDPKSITTAPTGSVNFAEELAGKQFLNVAAFPTATFASRAFHVVDATHGKVDGDLTVMGKTQPVTFDVELVGAGPFFHGPVIGVTARTAVNPTGLGLPPALSAPIEVIVDTEFDKKG